MNATLRSPHLAQLLALVLIPLIGGVALAQEETPEPPPSLERFELPGGRWEPLDRIQLVVNSDPITLRGLERDYEDKLSELSVSTDAEHQALMIQVRDERVDGLLMKQAGEDMGFDPEMVKASISGRLGDQMREQGGAHAMSKGLRSDDSTATQIREEMESNLYSASWQRRVMGLEGGADRPAEDRFPRPGELRQLYQRMRKTGLDIEYLGKRGAKPASYELQIMLLAGRDYGSLAKARDKALEVRAALEKGLGDWDDYIDTLGILEDRGLTPAWPIDAIRQRLDPGDNSLVQYVIEAEVESYSLVLPYALPTPTGQPQVIGFMIAKLLAREAAVMPAFDAPGVQHDLGTLLQRRGDTLRVEDALSELKRSAYVWYPGIEQQKRDFEQSLEEREREIEAARQRNAEAQTTPEADEAKPESPPTEPAGPDPQAGTPVDDPR